MLRKALLGLALLLTLAGSGCVLAGYAGALPAALWGLALLVAIVFERWRYRKPPPDDSGAWQRTGEQFIDPESGEPTEVLYDPRSGERRYQRRVE